MGGTASLQLAIRKRVDEQASPLFAVLDFDGTCIVNDIAEATLAYICRNRLLRRADLLSSRTQYAAGTYHREVFRRYYALLYRGDMQSASLLCARIFAGFSAIEAETIVAAAIGAEGNIPGVDELYGIRIARGLAVRPALRRLIGFLNANKVQVWVVSASAEIAVRTAMKCFGLSAKLIALRNKLEDGVISTELAAPYSIREGKVDCIRTFIDASRRPVFAIGDSVHDLPMLEYAHISAVVDCNDKVTNEARRRDWFILRCKSDRINA